MQAGTFEVSSIVPQCDAYRDIISVAIGVAVTEPVQHKIGTIAAGQ